MFSFLGASEQDGEHEKHALLEDENQGFFSRFSLTKAQGEDPRATRAPQDEGFFSRFSLVKGQDADPNKNKAPKNEGFLSRFSFTNGQDDNANMTQAPRDEGFFSRFSTREVNSEDAEATQAPRASYVGQFMSGLRPKGNKYADEGLLDLETPYGERTTANRKEIAAHLALWNNFEEYWNDVGLERYKQMMRDYPYAPPSFKMPRLRYWGRKWDPYAFERAMKGPMPEDIPTTVKEIKKETKEEKEVRLRQQEITRRALEDSNFCRIWGCQIMTLAIWFAGEAYIYSHFKMQFWRFTCWFTLLFFQLIFANNWVKAVGMLRNVVFLWLKETEEHVEECGEVVILHIRRQIFSRVYGMLICDDKVIKEILRSDSSAYGHFVPHVFKEVEYVDDKGYDCKFVPLESFRKQKVQSKKDTSTTAGSKKLNPTETVTERVYQERESYRLATGKKQTVDKTRQLGLTMCVDLDGDIVTKIMKEDDWFAKLEFRLRREGPLVPDYKEFLGNFIFGDKIRFTIVMALFPVICFVGGFLLYTRVHELYRPSIYLDAVLMKKHFAVVLGMSLTAIGFSLLCRRFTFIYFFVNTVMRVLEYGVRGELHRHYPTVGDENNPHDVQDISLLWQKATTEENMKEVGEILWNRVNDFQRKATTKLESRFSLRIG